jgi:catechol 2,3-dioxygenase-like lactoylglutathione lyase family enzyme
VTAFAGFDHVDCRVRSLAAVETFYDALLPALGLTRKRYSYVDDAGEWHDASSDRPYNTVEFYEEEQPDRATFFIGIIERSDHVAGLTRVAFRVTPERLLEMESFLHDIGARNVERNQAFKTYPAIFFDDPLGTKLEIVARKRAPAGS